MIRALGEGKLYATIIDLLDVVELFASPLLRNLKRQGIQNDLLDIVNELLALTGLQDLREFRKVNVQQQGKTFEDFFLRIEMLRRGFQCSQLNKAKIRLVPEFYSSVIYSQNYDIVRFELDSVYRVEDLPCKFDFPSSNLVDAKSVKEVKSLVDEAAAIFDEENSSWVRLFLHSQRFLFRGALCSADRTDFLGWWQA
jgi:hypothetical protein